MSRFLYLILFVYISSCKPSGGEGESHTTSGGEELRVPFNFSEQKPERRNPDAEVVTGSADECPGEKFLFNGYCLESSEYVIWVHPVDGHSFVTVAGACDKGESCPEQLSYVLSDQRFRAVSDGNKEALDYLIPVYSLSTEEGIQFLTNQPAERDMYKEKLGYLYHGVLFYLAPGSIGSHKFSRFTNEKSWVYRLDHDTPPGFSYDTSLGNTLKL